MYNMEYQIGEKVIKKKKHPCGGDLWEIVRVGADFKIRCVTCGRVVMLTNEQFNRAVKRRVTE